MSYKDYLYICDRTHTQPIPQEEFEEMEEEKKEFVKDYEHKGEVLWNLES